MPAALLLLLSLFTLYAFCLGQVLLEPVPKWRFTGYNSRGALGNGLRDSELFSKQKFFFNEIAQPARKVGCIKFTCYVLTYSGMLYFTGYGNEHGSGVGYYEKNTPFHEFFLGGEKWFVDWIEEGDEHFLIRACNPPSPYKVTRDFDYGTGYCGEDATLMAFGNNLLGALGVQESKGSPTLTPHRLPIDSPATFDTAASFNIAASHIVLYKSSANRSITVPQSNAHAYDAFLASTANLTRISTSTIYLFGKPKKGDSILPQMINMDPIWNRADLIVQVGLSQDLALALSQSGRLYSWYYMSRSRLIWPVADHLPNLCSWSEQEPVDRISVSREGGILLFRDGQLFSLKRGCERHRVEPLGSLLGTTAAEIRYLHAFQGYFSLYHDTQKQYYLWRNNSASSNFLPEDLSSWITDSPQPAPKSLRDARMITYYKDKDRANCSTIGIFGEAAGGNTQIRVFGRNEKGTLGRPEEADISYLEDATFNLFKSHHVHDIQTLSQTGQMFMISNSNSSNLYQWGGVPNQVPHFSLTPAQLSEIGNRTVHRIVPLNAGIVGFTEHGVFYLHGFSQIPRYIPNLQSKRIKNVWHPNPPVNMLDPFIWFQTIDGEIFVFNTITGKNETVSDCLKHDVAGAALSKVSGSEDSEFFVVKSQPDNVFRCLFNGTVCTKFDFQGNTTYSEQVVQVEGSLIFGYVLMLTKKGTVYGFGKFNGVAFCEGSCTDSIHQLVRIFESKDPSDKIVSIGVSKKFDSYALSARGNLWILPCRRTIDSNGGSATLFYNVFRKYGIEISKNTTRIQYPDDGMVTSVRWNGLDLRTEDSFFTLFHNSTCGGQIADDWQVCNGHGRCMHRECYCFHGFSSTGDGCVPNEDGGGSDNEWVIILVVILSAPVGAACICSIVLLLFIFGCANVHNIRTKKRVKSRLRLLENEFKIELMEQSNSDMMSSVHFDQDMFRISMGDLDIEQVIGSGGSGATVVLAKYENMLVAVKMFRARDEFVLREFVKEVDFFCRLRHDNIVSFIGFVEDAHRCGVVMEYCPNGSLASLIEKHDPSEVSLSDRKKHLLEVARGMQYLHSQNIIHRDLKMENTLISRYGVCKLMDFGLSRLKDEAADSRMTMAVGSSLSTAPEIFTSEHYNETIDVFSFGIMMYEVLGHTTQPYGPNVNAAFIGAKVAADASFRPSLDRLKKLPHLMREQQGPQRESEAENLGQRQTGTQHIDWMFRLMERCWSHHAEDRPSFAEIISVFEANTI